MNKNEKLEEFLFEEKQKDYYLKLSKLLDNERKMYNVLPPENDVFNFIELSDFENIKIVLIGQDPYHTKGFANGLAFSVNKDIQIPRSLLNIYKELENSIDFRRPNHGDLSCWARKGMLLMNTCLTVIENEPASHKNLGWEILTDNLIKYVSDNYENVCFVLLGNFAKTKSVLIDESKHKILFASHPSPLSASRGFLGSNIFVKVNEYLVEKYGEPFDFTIKNL